MRHADFKENLYTGIFLILLAFFSNWINSEYIGSSGVFFLIGLIYLFFAYNQFNN